MLQFHVFSDVSFPSQSFACRSQFISSNFGTRGAFLPASSSASFCVFSPVGRGQKFDDDPELVDFSCSSGGDPVDIGICMWSDVVFHVYCPLR